MSPGREVERAAAAGDPRALARALVAIPSVNPSLVPDGQGEARIARRTSTWLTSWGFDSRVVEVAPDRCNVVARLPAAAAGRPSSPACTLLLNGHLDTVGVQGMTVPPFDAVVRGGRLMGRGSCDMKGGLAAILATAATLAREGCHGGTLVVALTADEEHASLGMESLVAGGLRADAAVVCEPTGLTVMPAHKGFLWMEVAFRGRAAHGSRPEVGVDAIRHAGLYLAALEGVARELAARPPHPLLGRGSFHAGTIEGGTAASVYPDLCTLTIERRTLPGEAADEVVADFREALESLGEQVSDLDAALTVGLGRPGTEVGEEAPVVQGLLRACERRGRVPGVAGMTAWVDAAFLNEAGIPAVCFGPGSIAQAHSADEWCDLSEIEACAGILTDFARDFLGG